jgi:very-short-patch-repair endonuclease
MTVFYNKTDLLDRRRALRRDMPPAERQLWARLRAGHLYDIKFRRQYSVDNFIVDFYCPAARLAIELDGETHTESRESYDRARQAAIEAHGITFLRFSNQQVYEELDGVVEMIAQTAASKMKKEPPLTPP